MPRMCCVTGCNSNYRRKNETQEHVATFRLPKVKEELDRWLKNIPRENIPVTKYTVVCEKHWPENYATKSVNGKLRPVDAPTIFTTCDIKPSQIPTPCPKPRSNKRALSSARNAQPDQKKLLRENLTVDYEHLTSQIHERIGHLSNSDVVSYQCNNATYFQSEEFLVGGVPKFILKIHPDLTFEAFYSGVRTFIPELTSKHITKMTNWWMVIEAIRYLKDLDPPHRLKILAEDLESLNNVCQVGKKVYSMKTMVRAFEYFSTSRATYKKIYKDYKLPSITTLTKITSKTTNTSSLDFITKVINKLPEKQRQCNILIDEIHVKPQLLFHGGKLFGKAENDPNSLAKSVLAIMIQCLHGGPKFLAKIIPVSKVSGKFQFDLVKKVVKTVNNAGGETIAIICDDNKVNQKFFKLVKTENAKPWITTESDDFPAGIFLLFDFVHLFKSIRNNFYTEKTREISYKHGDMEHPETAKWSDLVNLFKLDQHSEHSVKYAHKLTEIAISPKPIERQNVATMLKVFCEETVAALRQHPHLDTESTKPTADFIELWVQLWKIINIKAPFLGERKNDPLRAEFRSCEDERFGMITRMVEMIENMDCHNGEYSFNCNFTFQKGK